MEKEKQTGMDNQPETKEVYRAPVIETVEVRVEQGFGTYGGGRDDIPNAPGGPHLN